jgi:hypothetical protein
MISNCYRRSNATYGLGLAAKKKTNGITIGLSFTKIRRGLIARQSDS